MRSVCLLLMVTLSGVRLSSLCPSSCVVCSDDVIICQKLLSIIDAPVSTKALMLTDGLIDSVGNSAFSNLSNMSVLALSNNIISSITEKAFQSLSILTRLSLDHNHISSQSLNASTFSGLLRLEMLQLGNNHLQDIDGSWFQSSRSLQALQLEGNLLTSLNSSSFTHADLRNLETLDLSDNLIVYLGRDSFRTLPHLRSLDLSRNQLRSAPDAFSYLPLLSTLNLDLNRWSCTCDLRALASFLNAFIPAPERVLYGQKMVCVSADNPSVKTVLELNDVNCGPANRNSTVEVVGKSSNTSEQYIRNVAIAIVFSFLGGVGITLGIIAIAYNKISKKIKLMQEENEARERKTSSPETAQWNFCEGKDTLSMSHALYNSNYKPHQPWDREDAPDLENHFTCHKCSSTGKQRREIVLQRAGHVSEQINHRLHKDAQQHSVSQQRSKDTSGRRHNERGSGFLDPSSQHRGGSNEVSAVRIRQLALSNHFSALQRDTLRPPDQNHSRIMQGNQSEDTNSQPIYQTISCLHCHQTYEYRQAGRNFPFTDPSVTSVQNRAQTYDSMLYGDIVGYDKTNAARQTGGFRLASQRSVTFDLAQPEDHNFTITADRLKNDRRMKSAKKTRKTQAHLKTHKTRGQARRTLKVKLNLNPIRKNKVHPKSDDEEDTAEDKMFKKAKKEKLRSKKDRKKSGKKSKDDIEGLETEDDETIQDTPKMKHTKKGNKESKSKDTDDVTREEQQNCVPVEGETFPEAQVTSALALTLALTPPDKVLDATDSQQPSSPNTALPVSESAASQEVLVESSSSDLMSSSAPIIEEYMSEAEGSPKRKLRIILPEQNSSRPPSALDKKIR